MLLNIVLEFLATAIRQERKKSDYPHLQILYIKDPKNPTKKLLDIINIFSKIAGHKKSIYKINSFSIHQQQTD
jgi:hypothetical protein